MNKTIFYKHYVYTYCQINMWNYFSRTQRQMAIQNEICTECAAHCGSRDD